MSTATEVELDARTRDSISAPRDAHTILLSQRHRPCEQPAEWIIRVHMAVGPCPDPFLLCDEHTAALVKHLRSCTACAPCFDITTERI